jgi:hypothetical protein
MAPTDCLASWAAHCPSCLASQRSYVSAQQTFCCMDPVAFDLTSVQTRTTTCILQVAFQAQHTLRTIVSQPGTLRAVGYCSGHPATEYQLRSRSKSDTACHKSDSRGNVSRDPSTDRIKYRLACLSQIRFPRGSLTYALVDTRHIVAMEHHMSECTLRGCTGSSPVLCSSQKSRAFPLAGGRGAGPRRNR